MVSRTGDPESEVQGLNCDLRLITGRMAQTMENYEGKKLLIFSTYFNEFSSSVYYLIP